jgi:ABC-type branched-subunit amino acid transport system substrate-binding protein
VKKPYVLQAAENPISAEQAAAVRASAKALGMQIAGAGEWDAEASDYIELMQTVKASGADALVLAGLLFEDGPQLIKDKVKVMGPNNGRVKLLVTDGQAEQTTIDDTGPKATGLFLTSPAQVPETLTRRGEKFVNQLAAEQEGQPVELYAPYAGQAAEILLGAIGASPNRADVIEGVLQTEADKGIVGVFTITPTGDPSLAPISVSVAGDVFTPVAKISPPAGLVAAARGG